MSNLQHYLPFIREGVFTLFSLLGLAILITSGVVFFISVSFLFFIKKNAPHSFKPWAYLTFASFIYFINQILILSNKLRFFNILDFDLVTSSMKLIFVITFGLGFYRFISNE